MEGFVKGDIVVVNFPFSDLSSSKRRPALVLAYAENGDYLFCQITSKNIKDSWALKLSVEEIIEGELFKSSKTLDQTGSLLQISQSYFTRQERSPLP